ncbi:MAG: helix-turn-helix domain-containing protein [Bacteroidales bacterium]|jgi:transcriptional regulator with XRE-family HTH domain|nr:helix-turn-helix domain-containing protein [Bacteroidales bacterium]
MSLLDRVKQIAKDKDLTLKIVADRMGITISGLYKHLKNNPSLSVLKRLSEAMEVKIVDLFKDPDNDFSGIISYKGKIYKIDNKEDFFYLYGKIEEDKDSAGQ